MSSSGNPWNRNRAPLPRSRVYVWLAVMLVLSLCVWGLFRIFPEVTLAGQDEARFVQLVTILTLVATGVVFSRRFTLKESLRNIAIWCGIAAVLAIGYAYQDVVFDIGTRLRGEVLPREPIQFDRRTLIVTESEGDEFVTTGQVNGVRVRFIVDTGASDIVLSPADATRAGIDAATLVFSRPTETANGVGYGAPVNVSSLAVGSIRLNAVNVVVNQTPMDSSLLGMAFLRRLKSFEVRGRKLYLHSN